MAGTVLEVGSTPLYKIYHVTCDNALTYVDCGFEPGFIFGLNHTDQDTAWVWMPGQADGHAASIVGAVADVNGNGVSIVPQTNGTHYGFSIGTDAVINENAKHYDLIVFRKG
ncbi:MAG: hypothetical protein CV089_02140 [Nitrospira sp. WS110]|nr:hypothetical protein [Nitrospira sp. WS110]